MKNFALIGAAGYVAPRHMQAIRETGHRLVAALDPRDSVGVMDSYFPEAHFFTEFERFDRHLDKLRRQGDSHQVDMVSVCSPNYLHDAHVRFGLRCGADVICEKPLVLNPWNLDGLLQAQHETGRRVFTILQLRVHPAVEQLRQALMASTSASKHEVDLAYITSRGRWYLQSWKAQTSKSGGIATNIGVHFFDLLHYLFGACQQVQVHHHDITRAGGYLEYERARVRWFVSIEVEDLPSEVAALGKRTYRSITVDGQEVEFSEGFTDLHTLSYRRILTGGGFGPEESRSAISTVAQIRTTQGVGLQTHSHPLLRRALTKSSP